LHLTTISADSYIAPIRLGNAMQSLPGRERRRQFHPQRNELRGCIDLFLERLEISLGIGIEHRSVVFFRIAVTRHKNFALTEAAMEDTRPSCRPPLAGPHEAGQC